MDSIPSIPTIYVLFEFSKYEKKIVFRLSQSKQFDMTHYLDFLLDSDDYLFERLECNIYVLPSLYYQSEVFSNCF